MPCLPLIPARTHHAVNTGHRGYRGKFAENSIHGFNEAVKDGAKAIEMDIQVSKDDVVVVSHDENTERCFNKAYDITNTDFKGVLDQLTMKEAPHEHMPTFVDVAKLFTTKEYDGIVLMIDIKRTNHTSVVEKIVRDLKSVNPDLDFWAARVTLGLWKTEFLEPCKKHAPQFDLTHIGISQNYAAEFIKNDQVKVISLCHLSYTAAGGEAVLREIKAAGKLAYSWTINDEYIMNWAIAADIDGVITDYVQKYADVQKKPIETFNVDNPMSYFSWADWISVTPKYLALNAAFAVDWRRENAKILSNFKSL
ncbi:Phosphatidylglycerol phospholipase C [Yarrowia sp. B02]|nr:Phosphatidylglycerol phospholipase C [Yarrowia sp. B02]